MRQVNRLDKAYQLKIAKLETKGLVDIVSYNIVRAKKTYSLIEDMEQIGIASDVQTSRILIEASLKEGNSSVAMALFDQMISMGLFPDRVLYNSIMDNLRIKGKIGMAQNIFHGVAPDLISYNMQKSADFARLL